MFGKTLWPNLLQNVSGKVWAKPLAVATFQRLDCQEGLGSPFGKPFSKRLRGNVSTFGSSRGFKVISFSSTTSASYEGTVSEMSLRAILKHFSGLVTLMKNVYSMFS